MCRSADTRRTSARVVGVLAATVVALGLQVSPASAGSASSAASMMVASLSAPQGGTITISGNVSVSPSCPSGTAVQLTSTPGQGGENLFANGMGPQAPRDASGNFRATFAIPASTPVGSYTIGVRCGDTTVASSETLTVTAAAQAKPSITVSPASAHPGDSVSVSGVVPTAGTVFCPSTDATLLTSTAALFPPDGVGPQVRRDASGNFRLSYAIPSTTTPGTYQIGVRCGGGNLGVAAALEVTTTASSTTTTTPATTTTTTTTAGSTTTTSNPSTTAGTTTTVPVSSTAAPPRSTSKKSNSTTGPLRWVALGTLGLVVVAGAVSLARRGRTSPPS